MPYRSLVIVQAVFLFVLLACGEAAPQKSQETTAVASAEQVCSILPEASVRKLLELGDGVELTIADSEYYGAYTCDYEYEDGSFSFTCNQKDAFESDARAKQVLEAGISALGKGVSGRDEGSGTEMTFKADFERIEGLGIGAAWKPKKPGSFTGSVLMFAGNKRTFTININQSDATVEQQKQRAIAAARIVLNTTK